MTPIPPLNLNFVSSAAAGSEETTPRNIVQANAFFITHLPLTTAFFRMYLTSLVANLHLVKVRDALLRLDPRELDHLAHFSVSSAMSLPKSAGELIRGGPPRSATGIESF
jgi:hypothetical protein